MEDVMYRLPTWMRGVMLAAGILNLVGTATFVPRSHALREIGGFPDVTHPLYLSTIGVFILIFGIAYLWSGATGRADRQFVAVAAAGKLAFFALLVRYWAAGILAPEAPLSGLADLVFGLLFLYWLVSTRGKSEAAGDSIRA
jgi:hypothetical protein